MKCRLARRVGHIARRVRRGDDHDWRLSAAFTGPKKFEHFVSVPFRQVQYGVAVDPLDEPKGLVSIRHNVKFVSDGTVIQTFANQPQVSRVVLGDQDIFGII